MSEALIPAYTDAQITAAEELEDTVNATREYIEAARSDNTLRGYRSDWRGFTTWCMLHGLEELPATPDTVASYAGSLGGRRKPATIARHLAAIRLAHRAAGLDSPTAALQVEDALRGIRRKHGSMQTQKEPATVEVIRRMTAVLPHNLIGLRDRAILLTGFSGAFRRSELVSLDRADIRFTPRTDRGVEITLRRSKTDQEGHGALVLIPVGSCSETCPVQALRAWCEAAGISSGAVFRAISKGGHIGERLTGQSVALIVKRSAAAAGLDAVHLSAHSLRAGLATSAAEAGVPERVIQRQTRHKGVQMLRRYIRGIEGWSECAAAMVGL